MDEAHQPPLWTPPLVAYTVLAAAYFVVVALPGRPSYHSWTLAASLVFEALILWLLLMRRRRGWWVALALNVIGASECLAGALRTGGAPGWVALLVIQIASIVVLVWLWTPRLTEVL